MAVEERVLDLVSQQNKPFSALTVTDFVAQFGFKRSQVQKALDALVDNGKMRAKDFGKTRIYLPVQDDLPKLNAEEKEAKSALAKDLMEEAKIKAEELRKQGLELKTLRSSLSKEEIKHRVGEMENKINNLESKVESLRQTSDLVTDEERSKVQQDLGVLVSQWKQRKGIFTAIWGTIEEGLDRKAADVFEEIGVDTDKACGVSVLEVERMVTKRRKQ